MFARLIPLSFELEDSFRMAICPIQNAVILQEYVKFNAVRVEP
jgi:hypothetical protein